MSRTSDHGQTCLFVLDTNVLMHDPTALFRFQEHDIFLPMMVLEELDASKKGLSEVARNVRQVTRFLDQLLIGADRERIASGLPLQLRSEHNADTKLRCGDTPHPPPSSPAGKLFLQTHELPHLSEYSTQCGRNITTHPNFLIGDTPAHSPTRNTADNTILRVTLALQQQLPQRLVVVVSKDINLRIKAAVLGIRAEDYANDQVLEDVNLLYPGMLALPSEVWEDYSRRMRTWQEGDKNFYYIDSPEVMSWYPYLGLYTVADNGENGVVPPKQFEALVLRKEGAHGAVVELAQDYRTPRRAVWGITARNREQNFALNLLLNPEVDFVSLVGTAGTGKTLLALAAGLNQVLERNLYREIIMTRATVAVGEDIGFLPGTEEEKMTPWMGALMDNLEVLTQNPRSGGISQKLQGQNNGSDWAKAATADLVRNRVHIRSLAFMRGRTFLNKYLIVDEAQNLTPKQMKALITRAGPGTKVVCLGNISQIDTPYLTETSSGLTYVVDRFRTWDHGGHITLLRGERSRLADFASEAL